MCYATIGLTLNFLYSITSSLYCLLSNRSPIYGQFDIVSKKCFLRILSVQVAV